MVRIPGLYRRWELPEVLKNHQAYRIEDAGVHARLVARAFAQRRKTLRNSLKGLLAPPQLRALDVDPGQRAEELDVSTFAALANAACKHPPEP